jgi:hypothetical protein
MHEELITPENLSKELLKSVFDAAFMGIPPMMTKATYA